MLTATTTPNPTTPNPTAPSTPAEVAVLRVLAGAMVALAPLEGYLTAAHPQLGKLPSALLVLAWAAVRIRHRSAPVWHPAHLVLAGIAALLSLSAAVHAGAPFTAQYTARWLPFLLVTAVLIDLAAREVPVLALLAAAVAGAVVAGAGALYSVLATGAPRATGPLTDPNDLAFVLVAAVPLLAAVPPGRGRLVRTGLVVAAVVLVGGAAATFSRGGALALVAAVGWLALRRALPVRALCGALGAVAAAGIVLAVLAGPTLARAVREKSFVAESNVDSRADRWAAAARMLGEYPVLGVGPGGFREQYVAASDHAELAEPSPVAHNMFLEVAAELGLPAFALFLALVATAVVATERVLRAGHDRRGPVAVQASLVAVLVAATFLSEQYYLPLWLLVAVAAAADLRASREGGSGRAGAPCDQ